MPHDTPRNGRAFTLIELLTVIAIIGVLAAILIPTIARVRASANAAKCGSNLRQLATAALLWQQANPADKLTPQLTQPNPFVPGQNWQVSWVVALYPYMGFVTSEQYRANADLAQCPAARQDGDDWQKNSYGINALTADAQWPRGVYGLRDPARTILAGDVIGTTADPGQTNAWQVLNPQGLGGGSPLYEMAARHSGGATAKLAFYDGHVETVALEKYSWANVNGWGATVPENPWKPW